MITIACPKIYLKQFGTSEPIILKSRQDGNVTIFNFNWVKGRETFSLLTFDVKEVDVGSELVESFRKCSKTLVVLTSI